MAKKVIKNRYLMIGGTEVSSYIRSADIKYSAKAVDTTCDGDGTEINAGGILAWSVDVELAQDADTDVLGALLFALVGTPVALIMRAENAVKGVNNPEYGGTGLLTDFPPPLGGKTGDLAVSKISFKSAGTLARATA